MAEETFCAGLSYWRKRREQVGRQIQMGGKQNKTKSKEKVAFLGITFNTTRPEGIWGEVREIFLSLHNHCLK